MARLVPDQLHLVDGLYCFQGYEQEALTPGLLLGSMNPCALDIACAKLMGINPRTQFPQNEIALENGFACDPVDGIRWKGRPPTEVAFQVQLPEPILGPPARLPSVRIFWGKFSYPYNKALSHLLNRMEADLPIDVYVGGTAPTVPADGRWSICLGNASVSVYQGKGSRVTVIEGNPPIAAGFREILASIQSELR